METTHGSNPPATGFARFSPVPLGLIVISFFLPAVRECDTIKSPLEFAIKDAPMAAWIAPAYFAALLLGLAGLAGLARGRAPRPALGWAALVLAGLPVLGTLVWMASATVSHGATGGGLWLGAIGLAASLAIASTIAARARRTEGWARQRLFVTAYLPLTAIQLFFFVGGWWAQIHSPEHRTEIGPGAYLFVAGVLSLAVAAIAGSRRERAALS